MPTPTYTALQTITLGSGTSSVLFSSIPTVDSNGNSVKDLIIVFNGSGPRYLAVQLNGDTGSNYSTVSMYGTGSGSGVSGSLANFGYIFASWYSASGTGMRSGIIQFLDAKSTNKHKTVLSRHSDVGSAGAVEANVSRWANTSPITSIKVYSDSGTNFNSGTTISLYAVVG